MINVFAIKKHPEKKVDIKLSSEQKETIRGYLPNYVNEITEKSKGRQYICPCCGSGTGKNKTGAFTLNPATDFTTWTCFACGQKGDIFELYQKINHCDFQTAIRELSDKYILNSSRTFERIDIVKPQQQETITDYSSQFDEWHKHLGECDYLTNRGISLEVQNKHNIGYCQAWRHSKTWNAPLTPRIIIPTSRFSFLARDVRKDIPEVQQDYTKLKEGKMHIFNLDDLYKDYCYIVEGEIDCMSLETLGINAIGLGSCNQVNALLQLCKESKPTGILIFCLDNDDAGLKATQKKAEFEKLGIVCATSTILEEHNFKDINDFLLADKQRLENAINTEVENLKQLENSQMPTVEVKFFPWDFDGRVNRFLHIHGENIKYCSAFADGKSSSGWLIWNGKRWVIDRLNKIMLMVKDTNNFMKLELENYKQSDEENGTTNAKEFAKEKKNATSLRGYTDVVKGASFEKIITTDELDAQDHVLNTPDFSINLKTGVKSKPEKSLMLTKSTTVTPMSKDCPNFKKFLNEIFNSDVDLINYVQKMFGYFLSGSIREQKLFIFWGNGNNGKSLLLDIFREIMGDYISNAQMETFQVSKRNSSNASSDLARLSSARMVTVNETNEGIRLNEGLVKQLTGGDSITARFLYATEFEFVPKFKIVMVTNHKPIIVGTDNGIWRRIVIIPFSVIIPDSDIDIDLKDKLMLEADAILNWFIEGALKYNFEGLHEPEILLRAKKDYKSEMDVVARFIEQSCVVGADKRVKSTELYQAYKQWATLNNEYCMSNTKFGVEMSKKFQKVRTNSGWYYIGLDIS